MSEELKNPIVMDLRDQLEKLNLNTKGTRKDLEKRLRSSMNKLAAAQ